MVVVATFITKERARSPDAANREDLRRVLEAVASGNITTEEASAFRILAEDTHHFSLIEKGRKIPSYRILAALLLAY